MYNLQKLQIQRKPVYLKLQNLSMSAVGYSVPKLMDIVGEDERAKGTISSKYSK